MIEFTVDELNEAAKSGDIWLERSKGWFESLNEYPTIIDEPSFTETWEVQSEKEQTVFWCGTWCSRIHYSAPELVGIGCQRLSIEAHIRRFSDPCYDGSMKVDGIVDWDLIERTFRLARLIQWKYWMEREEMSHENN